MATTHIVRSVSLSHIGTMDDLGSNLFQQRGGGEEEEQKEFLTVHVYATITTATKIKHIKRGIHNAIHVKCLDHLTITLPYLIT